MGSTLSLVSELVILTKCEDHNKYSKKYGEIMRMLDDGLGQCMLNHKTIIYRDGPGLNNWERDQKHLDKTALIYACAANLPEITLKILMYPDLCMIETTDYNNKDALYYACLNNMGTVIIRILDLHEFSNNRFISSFEAAFAYACSKEHMHQYAFRMLQFPYKCFRINPESNTHFISDACKTNNEALVLELLKYPNEFDFRFNDFQCVKDLFKTSMTSAINRILFIMNQRSQDDDDIVIDGCSILVYTCKHNMSVAALLILDYDKISHIDFKMPCGKAAIIYACDNSMTDVVRKILGRVRMASNIVFEQQFIKSLLTYTYAKKLDDMALTILGTLDDHERHKFITQNDLVKTSDIRVCPRVYEALTAIYTQTIT
ncbi:MAG: hypothetical protein Gaeavirus11_20 [Gaeavirus sp.]|uniref:Ankyrin repeat protein n=1 Tax=Gaeavirus sp. TaxID=2487767 RepID=A0A3G4ZZ59_9VIRU|nr:MAG: hypothetical protein Gaeavirus11_20 [Gaeavirus sp.]